jgi:putative DNA primase/helicase
VTEHLLPVHHGDGENGKSTFFETVGWALGDYAAPGDPELLSARNWEAHPTAVADLFGLRFVLLDETRQGGALDEPKLKRLTGGGRLKARRMREDNWTFDPSHTFHLMTNHRPVVHGTDRGLWRRLKCIPWGVTITAAERDPGLKDKLQEEAAEAVLAWLVDGYRAWHEAGRKLAYPKAVKNATERWADDSDDLGRFIAQRCLTGDDDYSIRSGVLYAAWQGWAVAEGVPAVTQTAFSLAVERLGFPKAKAADSYPTFYGIKLDPNPGGEADGSGGGEPEERETAWQDLGGGW